MTAPIERTGYTVSACVDCYCAAAGVPIEPLPTAPAPLALLDGHTVVNGCLDCDPCGHPDCSGPVCECGWNDPGHGFSWHPCGACGSTSGGSRFPLTAWQEPSR
jgi:hypothetical protein